VNGTSRRRPSSVNGTSWRRPSSVNGNWILT
jgi:hypothetical protein